METHHVFLVPGFFGFTHIGTMAYWGHVEQFLTESFAARGLSARVHSVRTPPTASLRKRASTLCAAMIDAIPQPGSGDRIYLLGHSTGGLDARLLMTGQPWLSELETAPWLDRVRAVVMVATPHKGTPTASFFASLLGQRLLEVLSLATIHTVRFGSIPLSVMFKLAGALSLADGRFGFSRTLLDQLFDQLLNDFTPDRRLQIQSFFSEVNQEQALLTQLTPESMDVFDGVVVQRPGVGYYSVVTRSPRPGLRSSLQRGLDPYAQAMHGLYHGLHRLAASDSGVPMKAPESLRLMGITAEDNDGIVPTLSQLHGELLKVIDADHLDVLGHFRDSVSHPPHYDWLVTGAGFDRGRFEGLWRLIVDTLLSQP